MGVKFIFFLVLQTKKDNVFSGSHYVDLLQQQVEFIKSRRWPFSPGIKVLMDDQAASLLASDDEFESRVVSVDTDQFMLERMRCWRDEIHRESRKPINEQDLLIFLDLDLFILGDLSLVPVQGTFGVVVRKDELHPVNGGFLAVIPSVSGRQVDLIDLMVESYESRSFPEKRWFGDQTILGEFYKNPVWGREFFVVADEGGSGYFEPKYSYKGWLKLTRCTPLIVHFKGVSRHMLRFFFDMRRSNSLFRRAWVSWLFLVEVVVKGRANRHRIRDDDLRSN